MSSVSAYTLSIKLGAIGAGEYGSLWDDSLLLKNDGGTTARKLELCEGLHVVVPVVSSLPGLMPNFEEGGDGEKSI